MLKEYWVYDIHSRRKNPLYALIPGDMMKSSYVGAILIGLSSLMSFALIAADSDAGKAKSALCAGCHGIDGNSVNGAWPILAGQHASYLVKQMKNFKSAERTDPVMQGMVAALSEEDMQDIAAYFASQKANPVAFDEKLVAAGESIYRGGITETSAAACMACHSPGASGNELAAYPSLKGQHSEYLVSQLKKFRDATRSNDPGSMMRAISKRMTDDEIMAVAAYISAIR
jgi:cytochrome c553